MTIAVAIRIGSAVVFAADSKLTTMGLAGFEQDGSPRWIDQTYDNATKIVHDRGETLMAMVAGHANLGQVSATDYVSRSVFPRYPDVATQDVGFAAFVAEMVEEKRGYWAETQVPEAQWPGPTILLASPGPGATHPRVWRVNLEGPTSEVTEILQVPGVFLEGAYVDAFTLLYGFNFGVLTRIAEQVGTDLQGAIDAASNPQGWLRPVDRINLWAMPPQDAVDFAVFLANVQVEMDRFLPGTPACGGPIDVMMLRTAPEAEILVYAGKELHHPRPPRLG